MEKRLQEKIEEADGLQQKLNHARDVAQSATLAKNEALKQQQLAVSATSRAHDKAINSNSSAALEQVRIPICNVLQP